MRKLKRISMAFLLTGVLLVAAGCSCNADGTVDNNGKNNNNNSNKCTNIFPNSLTRKNRLFRIYRNTVCFTHTSYLIRSYFDQKGSHMQFNVVSRDTLLDAQAHPENYKSLVVRVAGYSALFTTLSKSLQDDIINRTEQGEI